jgi:YD repeat-containing protein
MFAPGLFAAAPQEFFASISNEWFTDSAKTLELGLVRFQSGLRHPLEQALFMAEVYSLGGDRTYLYALDTQGNLYRGEATLGRAPQGNIVLLQMPEGRYEFEWDRSGNLTAANYTPRNARPR